MLAAAERLEGRVVVLLRGAIGGLATQGAEGVRARSARPGESKPVRLSVSARDLRHWGANGWELARGVHTVLVGHSANPALLRAVPFTVE